MARTSLDAVQRILDTSLDPLHLKEFLDDASLWVTANLANEGLSDALLTAIEKYLAADFATARDPRLRSNRFDDVAETYVRDTVITDYLKKAMGLDPTGKVRQAFASKGDKTAFRYRVGTTFTEEAETSGVSE